MAEDRAVSGVRMGTPTGRAVVTAAALGSGMALLDATVVNVALKTIGEDLDASLAQLQWITNGYLLSLASLILLGGALGDRFGRRRIFVVGTAWFAAASLLCGLAPDAETLVVARVLQGVGGALLTPGSLAMIQGAFAPADRPRAIGAWSGLASIASAVGPFVGGALVDFVHWRWIFLVNAPLAAVTIVIAHRAVPETRDPSATTHVDVAGALLATLTLGGTTYALIQWGDPLAWFAAAASLLAAAGFVLVERRTSDPMLDLAIFADRTFTTANLMTLLVYAALGAQSFFLTLQLQTVSGWSPLEAGLASLPVVASMILLAAKGGELGARIGPRIPMTVGPGLMAMGCLVLLGVGRDAGFWVDVLPGVVVFGLGLALMVAPLTATVLAAAPDDQAGVASGVNNAVARAGSLLAVAALPVAVGLTGEDYAIASVFGDGYRAAMLVCAGLLGAGGAVSWLSMPHRHTLGRG